MKKRDEKRRGGKDDMKEKESGGGWSMVGLLLAVKDPCVKELNHIPLLACYQMKIKLCG